MSEITVAIASEINPPPEPKKSKKARPSSGKKRGPARPYRKITDDILAQRIKRLSERLERSKKQHDSARALLTKYSHERLYRDKDAIQGEEPTVQA